MSTTVEMPQVHDCSVTGCAYNHDGCHAFAVSINADAACATFLSLNAKGGLDVVAQVGACGRADCVHNADLECSAPSITIGGSNGTADCLSYQAR